MKQLTIATQIHARSKIEAGDGRDGWALARRLAGYLRDSNIRPNEEFAFSKLQGKRIGVSRFLCDSSGQTVLHAMISISADKLPRPIAKALTKLARLEFVDCGK